MIPRKIKITGQPTLSISIPESWDDITFAQLGGIMNEEDSLKRLSILTGIPYDFWETFPEMADFYVWVESKLNWSNEYKEDDTELKPFIIKDNEIFNFPEEVGILSIGLYKDIQSEAQENKDDLLSIYPLICASYYQLLKDGEYDYLKAKEYIGVFNQQPCKKVYNAAGFFLNKIDRLRSGTKKGLKYRLTRTIKGWLGLIGFQKPLDLKLSPLN